MKSSTCFGKITNKPLSVFKNEAKAQEAASYANREHNKALIPYQCRRCHDWHLAPNNRQTPCETCTYCTGGDGENKQLYPTKQIAKQRAKIIFDENYIKLKVYRCPYHEGWHLTKSH